MYMYSGETTAVLPVTLAEAKAGRFEPLLAQAAMMSDDLGSQIASGMHWSVLCAEDAAAFRAATAGRRTPARSGLRSTMVTLVRRVAQARRAGRLSCAD